MRWFSLLVIVFSLSALLGGYFSGKASVPPMLTGAPVETFQVRGSPVAQTDETADDAFSDDDVDTIPNSDARFDAQARLSVVVVSMGHSVALERPFLALPMPLTCVVDAHAPAAREIAGLAAASGKTVYVQIDADAAPADVAATAAAFPQARGIALRFAPRTRAGAAMRAFVKAAADSRLAVFDEFAAQTAARRYARAFGVAYAGRSMTVDNHFSPAYVDFMVEQAVRIARARGVVIMARPIPATLAAFQSLADRAPHADIATEGLPSQAPGNFEE